jgi:hypothetical protein
MYEELNTTSCHLRKQLNIKRSFGGNTMVQESLIGLVARMVPVLIVTAIELIGTCDGCYLLRQIMNLGVDVSGLV